MSLIRWRPKAEDFRVLAIALTLAGIVHICATLAIPAMTSNSAFRKLTRALPLNRLEILPPVTPTTQPLPFLAPDARYAMCRYDTSQGPVGLNITLPDAGWVMAIFSPEGDNFYFVTGQASRRSDLSLLIVPPNEQATNASADGQGAQLTGAPLTVGSREGVVILRAPSRGLAYNADVESELRKSRCAVRRT